MKYTGLSLSLCVLDLAKGVVPYDDIVLIIAGTNARCKADWDRILQSYQRNYWSKYHWAQFIATRLIADGKIEQPRLNGERPLSINHGHWIVRF